MAVASRRIQTEVLVIGGGATGLGTAWDAALRGFDVVLVERADLVEGTSGRFHGLLHSGGRYVVKDPVAAKECVDENALLRRLMPDCIEDTGGLFVTTPDDDPAYADRFLEGCHAASAPGRGARGGRGAAPRAAAEPRDPPRVRGAGRLDRRVEDRLVALARRHRPRRARAHLSPRRRPAPGRRGDDGRARARRAHGRGVRHRGRASSSTPRGRGPRRSSTWPGSRTSA